MREAATEEVMDIGCETTAPPAGTQSFSPQQLDCILALCKGQAVPEEQRQTLAGVLRDIRHTEVQRTLMDAISGASPIIARYLDDAERKRRSVWLPLRNRLFNLKMRSYESSRILRFRLTAG